MWKGVGELGASVLTDCLQDMVQDGATSRARQQYGPFDDRLGDCDINASLLVLLPKKPSARDELLGPVHTPEDTRPLMLVDTSNRLLANAIRWRLEPLVSGIIGEDQRGFLGGRAILENVVDL